MAKYTFKRTLSLIPVVIVASLLVFLMIHMMSGDPARLIAGEQVTTEDVERIRVAYGYDKPLYMQYFKYVGGILQGNFGTSTRTDQPVTEELTVRYPNILLLAAAPTTVAIIGGVGIGLLSAVKRFSIWGNLCVFLALIGPSTPAFYLDLMLTLVVCVKLQWLPITPQSTALSLILLTVTLSSRNLATIARMTRSSTLEILGQDYIQTTRAQGFSKRKAIFGCVLKSAMNTIVTVAGLQLGPSIGGAVITEKVFGWLGLGDLIVTSIKARDLQVVQSAILVIATSFVVVNLIVDPLYAVINPGIKLS